MTEFNKVTECMQDNTETIFTQIHEECESYWEDKDKDAPCVLEYMFNTPVDMMGLMSRYIENEKLRKQITADSFRKRTASQKKQSSENGQRETEGAELPEYVYVF